MAEQVTPSFEEMVDEAKQTTREQLLEEGDEDAVEGWDAMTELWKSGKMQEMIESGDYSDSPIQFDPTKTKRSTCNLLDHLTYRDKRINP